MRRFVVFCAVLLVMAPAIAAEGFQSPKALLQSIYARYDSGDFGNGDDSALYSEALNGLFKADRDRTPDDEVGAIDFDFYVDGQDYALRDLEIGEPTITGNTAVETVTFSNFDLPREIRFDFVKEGGAWKIDDVESIAGDNPYRLSELLTADPGQN